MKKIIILFIVITLFSTSLIVSVNAYGIKFNSSKKLNSNLNIDREPFDGYILYTPWLWATTYLINGEGEVVRSWKSAYQPALSVYLLENGNLIRSDYKPNIFFGPMGGSTGRVEKFSWYGIPLWEFEYSDSQHYLHHDIEPLPNGNILMIAWGKKTSDEAINAGRNPDLVKDTGMWPDHIIEVKPTGFFSGEIVWEWHVWDHLIQDYNISKNNYGIVANHPELIDINIGTIPTDWNHINSIDYNEELDQILLSATHLNEIWIIDHSTTTEEAAGHIGGNSGKGGDLLYRWGNPQTYRAGNVEDQKLFFQHDARWIESGCPGDGNILVLNNGNGRPGNEYTSVDEIVPPVDNKGNYYLKTGSAYGPEDQVWIYDCDFFAEFLGGAQRLANGNTLICDGSRGQFFEVTYEKEVVWRYDNLFPYPLTSKTQLKLFPFNLLYYTTDVFKINRYNPDYPGLKNLFS